MPIYDYHCDHCDHAFSARRGYDEGALVECPRCGKTPRRLLTAPAIVFKGSGWYKTDTRAVGANPQGPSETAKADSGEGDGAAAKPDRAEKDDKAKGDHKESSPAKSAPGEATS